jgi:3-oxoacyl-[acyl-carrier-protein] synthase-3
MKNDNWNSVSIRQAVESSLRLVLPESTPLPGDDEDWIENGLVDSMAHVEFSLALERALNTPNLFSKAKLATPQTIRSAIDSIEKVLFRQTPGGVEVRAEQSLSEKGSSGCAGIAGWGMALGSDHVAIDRVENEFALEAGTLRDRAGSESVRRATLDEDEASLARSASRSALKRAGVSITSLNWIIGTSETLQGLPSFASSLHTSILAPPTCRALDIGGGCVGLLNSLTVANSLLLDPAVNHILVSSADVHSRILIPGKVAGEFGGLFGDGASAFVISRLNTDESRISCAIRASLGSCAGSFSSALQIRPGPNGSVALTFDGESLAHAALDILEATIADLEIRTGITREAAGGFAIHQPNQRLTEIFIRRARLPAERVFLVAKSFGNLGASTCGVALSNALDARENPQPSDRRPVFLAAVGPGLLSAGILLD